MTNKKTLSIILAVGAVVIIIAAAIALPRLYAANESSDVATPSLSTAASESSGAGAGNAATDGAQAASFDGDIAGTWTIGAGSYAGYRVEEVLNGANVTVVGRTESVSGDAIIDTDTLTAATVTVDLASVTTDSDRRDNYFRTKAIDTSVNPAATFTVTEPLTLENLSATPQDVTLNGELTINGQTKPASTTAKVAVVDNALQVAGSIPVTWADYGVEAPNLGFVSVEDAGTVEFLTVLTK